LENFYNHYHRYLDLPFEIEKPDIFNSEQKTVMQKALPNHYDQNMVDFLAKFGMKLLMIECFFTPPNGGKVPIHTDFWWWETDFVKINKTWGPEDGKIIWYKASKTTPITVKPGKNTSDVEPGESVVYQTDDVTILTASQKDCTPLYEANTNKPSLVNTGILHGTLNPSNEPRWTICFQPVWDIETEAYVTWHEAMDIFKDYIVGE
jgi:hypothetical protein|tara:strand:- start:46 stop:663 length:618 start_codon:yes stop_codon:yes gene_type:complete